GGGETKVWEKGGGGRVCNDGAKERGEVIAGGGGEKQLKYHGFPRPPREYSAGGTDPPAPATMIWALCTAWTDHLARAVWRPPSRRLRHSACCWAHAFLRPINAATSCPKAHSSRF